MNDRFRTGEPSPLSLHLELLTSDFHTKIIDTDSILKLKDGIGAQAAAEQLKLRASLGHENAGTRLRT